MLVTVNCCEKQYSFATSMSIQREKSPGAVYRMFKKIEDNVSVHVASRDELEQAVQLAQELKTLWPGQYVI